MILVVLSAMRGLPAQVPPRPYVPGMHPGAGESFLVDPGGAVHGLDISAHPPELFDMIETYRVDLPDMMLLPCALRRSAVTGW